VITMTQARYALAVQVLQSMALVNDDEFPQQVAQVLSVFDANLVCRDDDGELGGRIASVAIIACFPSRSAFADMTDTRRGRWLHSRRA